jgi:hypothetical protein
MKPLRTLLAGAVLAAGLAYAPAGFATTLLGHFEFQCLDATGCLNSANMVTQVNYELEIFPDTIDFGTYDSGDTADITVATQPFINTFFANGLPGAPEPMVLLASIIGAGGGGQSMTKNDFLIGKMFMNALIAVDGGYDVMSNNGIDLALNMPVTHIRFQLFEVLVLPSQSLPGSALRTHFRYEFLSAMPIPEPGALTLFGLGLMGLGLVRRRSRKA